MANKTVELDRFPPGPALDKAIARLLGYEVATMPAPNNPAEARMVIGRPFEGEPHETFAAHGLAKVKRDDGTGEDIILDYVESLPSFSTQPELARSLLLAPLRTDEDLETQVMLGPEGWTVSVIERETGDVLSLGGELLTETAPTTATAICWLFLKFHRLKNANPGRRPENLPRARP